MSKLKDITGQVFGRLAVMYRLPNSCQGKAVWRCRCTCGKERDVVGFTLRKSLSKSCGCARAESMKKIVHKPRLPPGEAGFKKYFRDFLNGAKRRGLIVDLSQEQVRIMSTIECNYCGVEPRSVSKTYSSKSRSRITVAMQKSIYLFNGIDRINNNLGYTEGNVVPCCSVCNFTKGSKHSAESYIAQCEAVALHQKKGKK